MYNEEEHIESELLKQQKANPFRVPDGYFDSFDDRLMKKIQSPGVKKSRSVSFVRVLKPVLAVAASIALIYLLVNTQFTRQSVSGELSSNVTGVAKDDSTLNFSLIDESTLVNALFTEDKSNSEEINPDEMLAYLSSGLNEVQICSAIQNNK